MEKEKENSVWLKRPRPKELADRQILKCKIHFVANKGRFDFATGFASTYFPTQPTGQP